MQLHIHHKFSYETGHTGSYRCGRARDTLSAPHFKWPYLTCFSLESSFWPGVEKISSQIFISNLNLPKILSFCEIWPFVDDPYALINKWSYSYELMELLLWPNGVTCMSMWLLLTIKGCHSYKEMWLLV